MAKTKTSAHWSSTMSNTPLPEPAYYQWRRKKMPWSLEFAFSHMCVETTDDSEVRTLHTADQMHAHAAAVSADKDARIKVLEDALWAADLAFAEHGILAVHATRMQVRAALGDKPTTPPLSPSPRS